MQPRTLLILTAAVGLTACTGSTDPATGTVFDNFRNLQSGEFDRQIADKQAQADAIIAANNRSRQRIGSLEQQRASNASALPRLRAELASVRSEIAAARAAAQGNPARLSQLSALESQARAIDSDVARGGDASIASRELSSIRSAVRALSG